jgi:hypothetical protein
MTDLWWHGASERHPGRLRLSLGVALLLHAVLAGGAIIQHAAASETAPGEPMSLAWVELSDTDDPAPSGAEVADQAPPAPSARDPRAVAPIPRPAPLVPSAKPVRARGADGEALAVAPDDAGPHGEAAGRLAPADVRQAGSPEAGAGASTAEDGTVAGGAAAHGHGRGAATRGGGERYGAGGRKARLLAGGAPCSGFFPHAAEDDAGAVTVVVEVTSRGAPGRARVVAESPSGQGFAAAARACASRLAFEPATDALGAPTAAESVLKLRFARNHR